jgi:peptide/nickel transport system substrate-binding protein
MTDVRLTRARHRGGVVAVVLAGVLLLLGLAIAQSTLAASPSAPPGDAVFRVGWMQEPDNLNPYLGALVESFHIHHLNYDYLVGYDPKDFSPRPEIATSWDVSPDGKVWTFKIREGVTWSDGEPLTADDVAFSYNFIVQNQALLYYAYWEGIEEAVVIDPTTVEIRCASPKANMLANIVPIIPEHVWSEIPPEEATASFENPPSVVGSGPFQVVEWQRGKFLRLEANDDYWGGAPKVEELIFQFYTNPDSLSSDLKSGAVDAGVWLPPGSAEQLRAVPELTVIKGTSWRFNELGFNCYDSPDSLGNPVLLDEEFRRALNWAIDRETITDVAFFGEGSAGQTLLPPYSQYAWQPTAEQAYAYDPEKANAELDAAGYADVDGDGLRETKEGEKLDLRLYATSQSLESQSAAKLIVGWFEDVGVKTTLQVMDSGALLAAQYNFKGDTYAPDFDMFVWYWTQDPDPALMLSVPTSSNIGGWSDTLWWTPEYDELNAQQLTELDTAARARIAQQMQQVVWEDSPYLIFTYPYELEAYRSDRWEGIVMSPQGMEGFDGAAFFNYPNIDTYRFVTAKTGDTESGGAGTTTLIIVVAAFAAVVIGVIAWLMVKRRGRATEE